MIRQITGVIAGYAIFVVTSVALFKLSGIDPHAKASAAFITLTVMYGAVFSFVSGVVANMIAGTNTLTVNYALAFILGGFACFSLFKSGGSHWTQLLAIFIFAPVSVLGGLWIIKKRGK